MSILGAWALILLAYAAVAALGKRLGLIAIVSQLLLAALLPLAMHGLGEWSVHFEGAALTAPSWIKTLYGAAFALLLAAILSDVLELRPERAAFKLALPSFLVPFACGLACALWLLGLRGLSALALGLVFAITAIPVLYLYLRAIDYPPAASRRLLQAAILIDLLCWLLLGLGKGSLQPTSLLLPLLGALAPLPLYALGVRAAKAYGALFIALLFGAEHYHLNALLLAMAYLGCLAWLKLGVQVPLSARWSKAAQQYFAVPVILSYGVLQVDLQHALTGIDAWHWAALLALPIISKLLGNWLGLRWAGASFPGASRWRESLLLNIRGLSEIVFLNLLLTERLISPSLYLALLLMSLVATLMPALAGLHRLPLNTAPTARRPHADY